jgi:plasmid stabilization system protein ParE
MLNVILSPQAQESLIAIEEYTALHWGEERAEAYLHYIEERLKQLAMDPELGHQRTDVPAPYRVFSLKAHIAVYRVDNHSNTLEILSILHPSMDVQRRVQESLLP